jgi:hypothetical protein
MIFDMFSTCHDEHVRFDNDHSSIFLKMKGGNPMYCQALSQENTFRISAMTSTSNKTTWEIEEDIPNLSCHAAIELDNLILRKSNTFEAAHQLIEAILKSGLSSTNGAQTNGRPYAYLNTATALAFDGAIRDSKPNYSKTTVQDLIKEVDDFVDTLKLIIADPQRALKEYKKEAEELRSFCLALSKRALANEPPLYDVESEHPHRR